MDNFVQMCDSEDNIKIYLKSVGPEGANWIQPLHNGV